MKKLLSRLLLVVGILAPTVLVASPADAGWYYYSPSVCRASLAVQDRQGAADFSYWPPWSQFPEYHTVWGNALTAYWQYNGSGPARECGWLDRPTDDGGWYWDPDTGQSWRQHFVGGFLLYVQKWTAWYACYLNNWCTFVTYAGGSG